VRDIAINRKWHEKHRMPKNPTVEQRLQWHIEHSKHCDCRPLSKKLVSELRKRRKVGKE
jgi:hypothetical protein